MRVDLTAGVLVLATAAAAAAQPVTGLYLQGSAGLALPQQDSLTRSSSPPGTAQASASAAANAAINGTSGSADSGSAGWGFGNGFRLELQGLHGTQAAPANTN